jgi:uncharacterized protein
MKNLTKLWGDFKSIPLDINHLTLTFRLFVEKIEDPNGQEAPLYVGVNTLSGSIDLFTQEEGLYLDKIQKNNTEKQDLSAIPENFLLRLKNRGYLFPSREYEDLVFETIINRYKHEKYNADKILGFFAVDMGCPVKCKYCFEKKYAEQTDEYEKSVMDETSLKAAFNVLDVIKNVQKKEIDFVAGWGGEPLIEKNMDMNTLFVAFAKERKIPIGYFSSLTLLGDKGFDLLAKNAPYLKFMQTTLDAKGEIHDKLRKIPQAFDRTVFNIDRLLKADVPVIIRTNVGPHNIDLVPELAEFYEKKGWYDFPKFKAFIVKTYDRHHDHETNYLFSEDQALSHWLRLKDAFPAVRKMQTLKYAPALLPILRAFEIRESIDITQDDFEVETKPMLTYCYTGNRCEYVFTGAPHYSIYTCAECTGISKYKIGTYYPHLTFDPEKKKMWGMGEEFYGIRSIDTLKMCKTCPANTHCGGYCTLEAITAHGSSDNVYCKEIQNVIPNFIRKESARLYKRGRMLMDRSANITL